MFPRYILCTPRRHVACNTIINGLLPDKLTEWDKLMKLVMDMLKGMLILPFLKKILVCLGFSFGKVKN